MRVPESPSTDAPALEIRQFDLPLTSLRVGVAGSGPPVIMVPATISLIEDWASMVQFIGKRFTAHFFELPGHGGSTPFAEGYSAERVAETIGHLADAIGAEQFTLLGFSFGGLLTLKALKMMSRMTASLFSPSCRTGSALSAACHACSTIAGQPVLAGGEALPAPIHARSSMVHAVSSAVRDRRRPQ